MLTYGQYVVRKREQLARFIEQCNREAAEKEAKDSKEEAK